MALVKSGFVVACWLLGSAGLASAQLSVEALKAGKEATALLEVEDGEGGTGTAFCLDPSGLFVTNAHVIELGSKFKLVVNPARPGQATYPAKVIRVERKVDLALIQAEGAKGLTPLKLGRDNDLVETADVVAFGYPFGKALAKGNDFPSISINTGRITSLPMPGGKLSAIQLDVVLNPGNSGGPVLDKDGRVIGVVQGGVRNAGINFAIPVGRLSEILASPVVLLETPALTYKTRGDAADWTIRLIPASASADASVEVVVETDPAHRRTFAARPSGKNDGVFIARVVPAEGDSRVAPSLTISAGFAAGQIEGKVTDRSVKVATKEVRLGDLSMFRLEPKPKTVLRDGSELAGVPEGLDAVPVELGGLSVTVDLAKASKVEFLAMVASSLNLHCTVTVRRPNAELVSIERNFELNEANAASLSDLSGGPLGGSSIRPPELAADRVEIKLPGTVTDVTTAAGGRILLLTLKDIKKLAVFDVNAGKVVRLLAIPSSDALVAAGARKFLVVSPGQGILQRWDLATLERERTINAPFNGIVTSLVMGSRSTGPALVFAVNPGGNAFNSAAFTFLDLETLRPMKGFQQSYVSSANRQVANAEAERAGLINVGFFSQATERVQLRAAPRGEFFSAWSNMHSPAGMITFIWKDKNVLESHYEHNDVGYLIPGPDGRTLYSEFGGLYSSQLKPLNSELPKSRNYLPSNISNYFLGLQDKQASLFVAGSGSPLVTLGELDEIPSGVPRSNMNQRDPIADKRIQLIPEANLLVTLPATKDSIVLRRVNPMDLLKKSEIDYLFVDSLPVTEARKGKTYEYSIKVQSRRGNVHSELSSGPDGMKISSEGKLTWDVPFNFDSEEVAPIVLVKDASGQEIFHTFTIRVR